MKNKVIDFLRTAQEIIASDGEELFFEVRKRKRIEIAQLFAKTFDYDTDGDDEGCCAYADLEILGMKCMITFRSDCSDTTDILDTAYDMEVCIYNSDIELDTIPEIIAMLEVLALDEKKVPLALLNTSILTTAGNYSLKDITLSAAVQLVQDNLGNLDSAVGHTSTAEIMTTLLGVSVPVNRQMFAQTVGQQALVFKLKGRPEEGTILTSDEIELIGYKFQLLTRTE